MQTSFWRRTGLVFALLLGLSPLFFLRSGAAPAKAKMAQFEGKVVPMTAMLKDFGSKLDPDAAPHWLAQVTKDGKVFPLIEDDGSRMFYKDAKLLNRPMRLTGRLFKDTHLLQVVDVHSYVKGKLCEVFYWCDICSIRRNQKQICDCCGAQMVLREVPVKK
jgi:hypothetical protein